MYYMTCLNDLTFLIPKTDAVVTKSNALDTQLPPAEKPKPLLIRLLESHSSLLSSNTLSIIVSCSTKLYNNI